MSQLIRYSAISALRYSPEMDAQGYWSRPVRALRNDARAAGARTFECDEYHSGGFDRALGFSTIEPMNIDLAENLTIPGVRMLCHFAQPSP